MTSVSVCKNRRLSGFRISVRLVFVITVCLIDLRGHEVHEG